MTSWVNYAKYRLIPAHGYLDQIRIRLIFSDGVPDDSHKLKQCK